MGCTLQSNKQNENQEDVVEKDTAYMIKPF